MYSISDLTIWLLGNGLVALHIEWFHVGSKFQSKVCCAQPCNKQITGKCFVMESAVSKWVSSVNMGVPNMGIICSSFRFSPHLENNEQVSQPRIYFNRAKETRLEITENKWNFILGLSEPWGGRKIILSKKRSFPHIALDSDDSRPGERWYKGKGNIFLKISSGSWGCQSCSPTDMSFAWDCYWPGFLTSSINRNWWGQTRNSGKALLGPPLQQEGARTSNRFPRSLTRDGSGGGELVPYMGVRVGVCPGVGPEGWLRWSAHPLGGVVCSGHAQCPAFAPGSSEVAVGFLVFLYLAVHYLPQLRMYAVIFSPL